MDGTDKPLSEWRRGDRVEMTPNAYERAYQFTYQVKKPTPPVRGTVTGFSRDGRTIYVVIDGRKSTQLWASSDWRWIGPGDDHTGVIR